MMDAFQALAENRFNALLEAHRIIGTKNARIDYLIEVLKRIATTDDIDKAKSIAYTTIELMEDK